MSIRLKRTKQCDKCPWRKDVNPYDIPNYDRDRHLALANTCSSDLESLTSWEFRAMSCHEFPEGRENFCVGWLENQAGVGNNFAIRAAISRGDILGAVEIELIGPQHERFEDTIPPN